MTTSTTFNLVGRVQRTAREAAARAGVQMVEVSDMDGLRAISQLFTQVWGRSPEGSPMHSEVMRSMVHAGGLVNAARDERDGSLVGAAVLGRDVGDDCYGYIAAARPGAADRGIGRALKQHQRAWALERGIATMRWTFDPLVARNARFNLTRLGAVVEEYDHAFYGEMADDLNGTDVGDRLVARWDLRSSRALAAGEGVLAEPAGDPGAGLTPGSSTQDGPDGMPALVVETTQRWIRVPHDVVALRASDPAQARAWRTATATWFTDAFAQGLVALHVSRTGWYHLKERDA